MATKAKTRRTRTKKNDKKTYVAIVIDRSGSMDTIREAAWKGINEQIAAIKENADKGGDTKVTIVQFDNEFEVLRDNEPASKIHAIDANEYEPRGATALLDAVGKTIEMLETHEKTDDTGFLVVVISDGDENASKVWSSDKLRSKVKELEGTNQWTFTYMLSNTDMYKAASMLGASYGNMSSFTSSPIGTANAFSVNSNSSNSYLKARSAGVTSTPTFYNATGTVLDADSTIDVNNKKS